MERASLDGGADGTDNAGGQGADALTLIGSEFSYYTGKVRAYLRWKQLPFTELLATREVYETEIVPHVGWSVVPVLRIGSGAGARYVQDSSDIIDEVERLWPSLPHTRVLPASRRLQLVCALVELLADEWLVVPAMHYRWNFPQQRSFVRHAFGTLMGHDTATLDRSLRLFGGAPGRPGAATDSCPGTLENQRSRCWCCSPEPPARAPGRP